MNIPIEKELNPKIKGVIKCKTPITKKMIQLNKFNFSIVSIYNNLFYLIFIIFYL